jgi:type II secretory pathway pseudopilin PulG
MMARRPGRIGGGLSLVELVVVLGIVSLLMGLSLPAVQSARESARRVTCLSNLGQMGRAVNAFASARGAYPASGAFVHEPGSLYHPDYPIHVVLLPYLEMPALYSGINVSLNQNAGVPPQNATAAATTVSVFLCPSDPRARPGPQAPVSYRVNLGLGEYRTVPLAGAPGGRGWVALDTGGFADWPDVTRPGQYRDGTSHTLAFAEKSVGSGREGFRPSRDWFETLPELFETMDEWERHCRRVPTGSTRRTDGGETWIRDEPIYTGFYASFPPNAEIPDCGSWQNGVIAARSHHRGGVHAVMVDGSAHWIRSGIERSVWRALGTRQGGESIDDGTWRQ